MKKKQCSRCGFESGESANYCQKCGAKLKQKLPPLLSSLDGPGGTSIAGLGFRQMNLGPLGVEATRNQGKAFRTAYGQTSAQPLKATIEPGPDKKWYCPRCGYCNHNTSLECESCGTQF